MTTVYGTEISRDMAARRAQDFIGQFFKILPLKEDASPTLQKYIEALLREMLGMKSLMAEWHEDEHYLSLLGILQYFADHPECDVETVRSDVFKAIGIIRRLQKKYGTHS